MSDTRPGGLQIDLFGALPSAMPRSSIAPDEALSAQREEPAAVALDGKDPQAFRTIGEVAQALGIRQHVLRYWEEQFPMLRPVKRSGARRYYRPEDMALVETINRLVHHEGYTLRGARQLLEAEGRAARQTARGKASAKRVPSKPALAGASASSNVVSELRVIRAALAEALQAF